VCNEAGSTHDNAFAGKTGFGIMRQCIVAHFLFNLKTSGLLPFLLRDGFVNINRHMLVTRFKFQSDFIPTCGTIVKAGTSGIKKWERY
jgi:hypothetical protein